MNSAKQTISLVGATDGLYAMPLAVMLSSVGHHAGTGVNIDAYILDDGVPEPDKARVTESLPPNVRVLWCQPDTKLEGLSTPHAEFLLRS
jgi:hypothetical protein